MKSNGVLITKLTDMQLFKRKWTKWLPISIYRYNSVEYLMIAKINTKTGMIKTKSVKMHGRLSYTQTQIFDKPFSADDQLLKLINENSLIKIKP